MKYLIYILAMIPAIPVFVNSGISLDPYDDLLADTGRWMSIWFILLLALGPLFRSFRIKSGIIFKQPLGVAVYSWAILHLTSYFVFHSQPFIRASTELLTKPFLILGVIAFVLMISLGITSFKGAIRIMGKKWNVLHKLSLWTAAIGYSHALTAQKTTFTEFGGYSLIILILLAWRGFTAIRKV
jgi:sulfoxide reductase heme-binding subunit YedZ